VALGRHDVSPCKFSKSAIPELILRQYIAFGSPDSVTQDHTKKLSDDLSARKRGGFIANLLPVMGFK